MHIVAGVVSNSSSGVSSLSAGNNLNLSSATISDQLDIVWNADNYRKSSQGSEIGSVVTGGGGVHLQAGNDLTSVASKLLAKDALSLHATNQVEVLSGHSSAHLDEAYRQTQSSLLSNTTITTHEKQSNSLAIGSSLEANTVNINAKDIHIKGSRVIGDTETTLTAGQSVTIEAATNTINSSRSRNETSSGFMAAEGIRIGFGNQIQSLESNSASSTAAASTLASAKGNVTIQAGDQYKQVGSDVLTPIGNIDISAKKVDVVEAREISHQTTEQIFVRSGLDLGVSSVVSSTLQNANKQIKAASQTSDDRMKLLAASNATANLKMAADTLESNEIQVVLGFGQSNGQIYTASQTDTARNSTLQAGGNIHIQASGGGDSSNLTVQGSDISGREVKLVADNAVNLNAAQNLNMQNSHNENSSSSMGVAALLSSKGESLGVNASASRGNGNSYGLDVTNSNTHIVGAESVTIVSGGDTTLKGATVEGKQVNLNAKSNLNIVSLQDTSTYIEKISK